MQRSQRDTQRRNDYAALSSNMTAYMTNNNGSLPSDGAATVLASTAAEAAKKYINNTGQDPAGFTYSITVKTCSNDNCKGDSTNADEFKLAATSGSAATKVYIIKKATCANGYPKYLNSSRAFVIYGQLESGNGTYCSASQ